MYAFVCQADPFTNKGCVPCLVQSRLAEGGILKVATRSMKESPIKLEVKSMGIDKGSCCPEAGIYNPADDGELGHPLGRPWRAGPTRRNMVSAERLRPKKLPNAIIRGASTDSKSVPSGHYYLCCFRYFLEL